VDKRRRGGLVALGGGVVAGVLGEITSSVTAAGIFFAAVAMLCFVGGGVAIALSYREETSAGPGGSRLSLLSSAAGTRLRRRRGGAAPSAEPGPLVVYAARLNDELDRCEQLLNGSPSAPDAIAARDRLVTLVANPSYGPATSRGLIDEARVHEVSLRLAAAAT
jgi:hypothetical protein